MTIETLLSGLKPITAECFHVFAPFYAERAKHYVYPLFYQSITEMIGQRGFFYKIFVIGGRKTLAIFKAKTIMGTHSICLHIAPISIGGNISDEVEIIQECRKCGLTIKVCRADIQRYHIPKDICEPISGNIEYIYNATKISALEGGEFRKFRHCLRKVQKQEGYRHVFGATADIDTLIRNWDIHNKERGLSGAQSNNWKHIRGLNNEFVKIHSVYTQNRIESVRVIERLSDKHWVLVMGVRNYNSTLNDINRAMLVLNCRIATKMSDVGSDVFVNNGAGFLDGLEKSKENLHPCCHQQIYKIMPPVRSPQTAFGNILKTIYKR